MPEINEYGQQVNDLVPGWQGAQVLRREAVTGRFLRHGAAGGGRAAGGCGCPRCLGPPPRRGRRG
ncbi:hypothetical protein M8371_24785, partial [Klebsiella pneumoniae]|nr:hypothetical protein [Klebsiella pneumoniae]